MFRISLLLLAAAFAAAPVAAKSGYGAFVSQAKKQMAAELKDPDSAKFRNLAVYQPATGQGVALCGEVNAKNAYGAYVGFRKFVSAGELAEVEQPDGGGLYSVLGQSLCSKRLASVD